MTTDAVSGGRRYDYDQTDDIEDRPASRAPSGASSSEKEARIIDSNHGETHYPPEMFAPVSPQIAGPSDLPHAPVEHQPRAPEPEPPAEAANAAAAPPSGPDHVHTTNANEVPLQKTQLPMPEVVALVRKQWPELSEEGARTIAAQWAAETGFGRNCYNNNFGNVKSGDGKSTHAYMHNIWEFPKPRTAEAAQKMVDGAHGLAELAPPEFKASKGYPADAPIVFFKPPHPQCRFKAYATPEEGMSAYLAMHKTIAASHPEYLSALNRGDVAGVAHILHDPSVSYSTSPEASYRAGMQHAKNTIDKQLGPA